MINSMENERREMIQEINSKVESNNEDEERKRLEAEYGKVWNTKELSDEFIVNSFLAPFVSVTRQSDGAKGTMMFQDRPRFYYCFKES